MTNVEKNEIAALKRWMKECESVDPSSDAMRIATETLDELQSIYERIPKEFVDLLNSSSSTVQQSMQRSVSPLPTSSLTQPVVKGKLQRSSKTFKAVKVTKSDHQEDIPNRPTAARLLTRFAHKLMFHTCVNLPLITLFAVACASVCLHSVTQDYFMPQIDLLKYTDERRDADLTYYERSCLPSTISTLNAEDLIIPNHGNFTTDDCVEHMMIHGASMYQDLLSQDTADSLRNWVLERNMNMNVKDAIHVIENTNRWSFYVGVNDDEIVSKAIHEIASHKTFRPALEKIVGRNPAIIEMTAITSAYGAADQFWHADCVSPGSTVKYAGTFIPSYSLFVSLQDTTAEMGATDICPGTHMCANSDADITCAELGYQVSGTDVWRRGNAIFMNQQMFHRGAAHQKRDGDHRSLFIITFAPRPEPKNRRRIGQGGSYSLRWDMWGHTLKDFEHATTVMTQPWTALRGLGIYKPKDADWGWDFISEVSMRIAIGDTGYSQDDSEMYFYDGTFLGLPSFLSVAFGDKGWKSFLNRLVLHWKRVATKAFIQAISIYSALALIAGIVVSICRWKKGTKPCRPVWKAIFWNTFQLCFFMGIITSCAYFGMTLIDESEWAKDIKSGKLYSSPFRTPLPAESLPQAVVQERDILISDRHDAKGLASLTNYLNYHPGNFALKDMIRGSSTLYHSLGFIGRSRLVDFIVNEAKWGGSNFLYLRNNAEWTAATQQESILFVTRAIILQGDSLLSKLTQTALSLLYEIKHGIFNSRKESGFTRVNTIMEKIFEKNKYTWVNGSHVMSTDKAKLPSLRTPPGGHFSYRRHGNIRTIKDLSFSTSNAIRKRIPSNHGISREMGSVMVEGSVVHAQYFGEHNEWYKGRIMDIYHGGIIDVMYEDGDVDYGLYPFNIVPFEPYKPNDVVEVRSTDHQWNIAKVIQMIGEKVVVTSRGRKRTVPQTDIRRFTVNGIFPSEA